MAEEESTPQRSHSYVVGELFGIDFQGQEAVTYNFNQSGHQITVVLPNLTWREEQELQSGTVQFAMTVKSGIIFMLTKFGDLPWMDAPFQWWLNPPALRVMPPSLNADEHILLAITAVDSITNRVRVLRVVTQSPEFSRVLHEAIRHQARSAWKGGAKHDHQLAKIYQRCTTTDLLSQATAVSKGMQYGEMATSSSEEIVLETAARHLYVPYDDGHYFAMPTVFSKESFVDFHRKYAIPVEAHDDDPIDIARSVRIGALKRQKVTVGGLPYFLWIVQPEFYSEVFGFELPDVDV